MDTNLTLLIENTDLHLTSPDTRAVAGCVRRVQVFKYEKTVSGQKSLRNCCNLHKQSFTVCILYQGSLM